MKWKNVMVHELKKKLNLASNRCKIYPEKKSDRYEIPPDYQPRLLLTYQRNPWTKGSGNGGGDEEKESIHFNVWELWSNGYKMQPNGLFEWYEIQSDYQPQGLLTRRARLGCSERLGWIKMRRPIINRMIFSHNKKQPKLPNWNIWFQRPPMSIIERSIAIQMVIKLKKIEKSET